LSFDDCRAIEGLDLVVDPITRSRGGQRASVQGATRRGSGSRCQAKFTTASETSQVRRS
jgi:hypothetical protein